MGKAQSARNRHNLGAEDQCSVCNSWFRIGRLHVCTRSPNTVVHPTPLTEVEKVKSCVSAVFARVIVAAQANELQVAHAVAPIPPAQGCLNTSALAQPDYLDDSSYLAAAFNPIVPILAPRIIPAPPVIVSAAQAEEAEAQQEPLLPPQTDGHPDVLYRQQVEAVMRAKNLSVADVEFIHLAVNQLGLSG